MASQDFAELIKLDVLDLYRQRCEASEIEPHRAFIRYLEETQDENDALEIVVQGNDKLNFTNRIND